MKNKVIKCIIFFSLILLFSCAHVEYLEHIGIEYSDNRTGLKYIYDNELYPSAKSDIIPFSIRFISLTKNKVDTEPVNISNLIIENTSTVASHSGYSYSIINKGQLVPEYQRSYTISFPSPQYYNSVEGITTFRGNNYRNTSSYGLSDIKEKKLEIVWDKSIGAIDTWTGVGWTGQPVIVKWPEETKKIMNIVSDKKEKTDLIEVIYGTLDGKIYFLDLDDGQNTRPPINTGFSMKGSVAVDPRGFPLLFAGQGINSNKGVYSDFKFRIFSLTDQSLLHYISGNDPFAYRIWGAFDSSPLIDANTDTMIQCGENGIIYTAKLNTTYDQSKGTISISPQYSNFRYKSPYYTTIGVENSPAAYKNLIYFTDNSGLLQCLDINTLKPVWIYNVKDDSDSTIIIEEISEDEVYLYTACEVDIQRKGGLAYMRKFNALTGKLIWENSIQCLYDPDVNGGALASPVSGEFKISNIIYFNIARTSDNPWGGILYAFDKDTGETIWEKTLGYYCWSSPLAIYDYQGNGYLIVCDSGGYMRLIDGLTGETLDSIFLGANMEGSPAAFNDMIVIGTRGQQIFGVRIK